MPHSSPQNSNLELFHFEKILANLRLGDPLGGDLPAQKPSENGVSIIGPQFAVAIGQCFWSFIPTEYRMTGIQRGSWTIKSVQVNSAPVLNAEGFRQLVVKDRAVAIEPAGIEFSVEQSTTRTAVWNRGRKYSLPTSFLATGELTLNLSRPCV